VFGAFQSSPGIFDLWGFGTHVSGRVFPSLTRFIRQTYGPSLFDRDARRIQVLVPWKAEAPIDWLTHHVGLRVERLIPDYCVDRSPMAALAYTITDFENHVQNSKGTRRAQA
jgi:hypothetical protein